MWLTWMPLCNACQMPHGPHRMPHASVSILFRVIHMWLDWLFFWISWYNLFSGKSCGPPNMDGRVLLMGKGYNIGDRMVYMCRAGFLPQRSTIITCGEDGQWYPPPSCKGESWTESSLEYWCWQFGYYCKHSGDNYAIFFVARCLRECQNGGTCIGLNKCKCPVGFTGMFCQKGKCALSHC